MVIIMIIDIDSNMVIIMIIDIDNNINNNNNRNNNNEVKCSIFNYLATAIFLFLMMINKISIYTLAENEY